MARAEKRATRRGGATPPRSRAERRAAIGRRRAVVALVASVAGAAIILGAWFPAGALISQRRTLSQTAATLAQLKSQDQALRAESKNLSSPSEIARIARQEFELIAPGEEAFQILPPPGKTARATDPYAGDPGNAPLVSTLTTPAVSDGATSSAHHAIASPGLFDRVLETLEFWR